MGYGKIKTVGGGRKPRPVAPGEPGAAKPVRPVKPGTKPGRVTIMPVPVPNPGKNPDYKIGRPVKPGVPDRVTLDGWRRVTLDDWRRINKPKKVK